MVGRLLVGGLIIGLALPGLASAQAFIDLSGEGESRNKRPVPGPGSAWSSHPAHPTPPAVPSPPAPESIATPVQPRTPNSPQPDPRADLVGRCPKYVADASNAEKIVRAVLGFASPINQTFSNSAKGDTFTLVSVKGILNAKLTGSYNITVDAQICHDRDGVYALLYGRSVFLKIDKISVDSIRIADKSKPNEPGRIFRTSSAR